jgi:hypothetical protein
LNSLSLTSRFSNTSFWIGTNNTKFRTPR